MLLIETGVAVELLEGSESTVARLARHDAPLGLSVLTLVELEAGIHRDPENAPVLRQRLDRFIEQVEVLPFTEREAAAYGRILAEIGYSRRKIIDRMIAATAILAGATLVTLNPRDYRDVPRLKVEDWSAP